MLRRLLADVIDAQKNPVSMSYHARYLYDAMSSSVLLLQRERCAGVAGSCCALKVMTTCICDVGGPHQSIITNGLME